MALAVSPSSPPPAKMWTGAGRTNKASEAANWLSNDRPQAGDWVMFGSMSSKDCEWDLHLTLSNLTLTPSYRGKVRLDSGRLAVSGETSLAGGELSLGSGTLEIGRRLLVDGDGAFQLAGGEVALGPKGILVVKAGTLESTGDRLARIRPVGGQAYPIEVRSGHVKISNAAGTVVTGTRGIVLYADAKVEQADNVRVREMPRGATALKVFVKKGEKLELAGWSFDDTVAKRVETAGGLASAVRVREASPETAAFVEAEVARLAAAPKEPLSDESRRSRRAVWTGGGSTEFASEDANWKEGAPRSGDVAVFGPRGSGKRCRWDLPVELEVLELQRGFTGAVDLGSTTLKVREDAVVDGGTLALGSGELSVAGRLRVGAEATLDLGEADLVLGEDGLALAGGQLASTGSRRPAAVAPLNPAKPYAVDLIDGSVSISSPAGVSFDTSQGLIVRRGVRLDAFDDVSIVRLPPGHTALWLSRSSPSTTTFRGWTFDETVQVNVDASHVPEGSQVLFADAGGGGFGSWGERDPHHVLAWSPDNPSREPVPAEPEAELAREHVQFLPLFNLSLLGGQYFFQGANGSISGNADMTASASIKNPDWPGWTLLPIYSGQYRGTKQVTDLVGGGTLFQQTMDQRAALRGVYELSDRWRLKPEASYKVEYLRETLDETWGNGLFDYNRPGLSLEGEYLYRDPLSLRFAYDFYRMSFPNYTSLASQASGTQGLAPELAGKYVLNSTNHAFTAAASAEGPSRTLLEGSAGFTLRSFGDQHIVVESGDLTSPTRTDDIVDFSASIRAPRQPRPGLKLVTGLGLDYIRTRSNQNSYDAQQVQFLPNYYDSDQVRASVSETASFARSRGEPILFEALAAFNRVGYPGRPVQDENGAYGSDPIRTDEWFVQGTFRYPIADHFQWLAMIQYDRQTSNMSYEKLYVYNYNAVAYLVGFSWAY